MSVLRQAALAAAAMAALSFAPAQAETAGAFALSSPADHIAIVDAGSGRTLYCKNCDVPMPPASMSKLMTSLIVAEKLKSGDLKPDTTLTVSEKAWRHGAQSDGSHMFLALASQVRVEDLLRGVIVVSANDACIVLAEGISGAEGAFVDLMNRRASELGLKTARFRNTTGLPDPDHVISSADLARLTAYMIANHPDIYAIYSERKFTYNGKTQENRNPLLGRFGGADGVKTGHTSASGYGLVGSAVLNGQRRIIVFNGLPSMAARAAEAERLMNAAFFDFSVTRIATAGEVLGEAAVHLGARPAARLAAKDEIVVAAHRSIASQLKAEIVYQGPLPAPIKAGDPVAELVISGPGFRETHPLVAAEPVRRGNWFARAGAGVAALFGGGA